jgi:N-hydroxyarylamine O-acetyltransferase
MNLDAFLKRIGVRGPASPDLATLRAVHRAFPFAVPFENLDVQLRRPVALDIEEIFDKIVARRRGGWCYELNGLMGWALREIGFDVTRLCAGVMRQHRGDAILGNHLCLRVQLEQPYLVDVGFGGSLLEPLPLQAAERDDLPYRVGLSRTDDGYWRFSEHEHEDPHTLDFMDAPADESLIARKCHLQQTDPESTFVKNLVVQRRSGDTHVTLRGRVLKTLHASHADKVLLGSADELVTTLRERFDLDVPEAAGLWPAICARHEELFAQCG